MPDPIAKDAVPRVVMLARPGKAADNLAEALRQAGAELLMVADPASTNEAALRAHRPEAVLVALEPSIEHALDKLDGLLMDPSLTVIFDEADLAAHRTGWDAARWVRHLSAKLRHDTDVLPPGAESDQEWQPSPGQIPKPSAAYADVDMAMFAQEAVARADCVPADGMPAEALIPASRTLERSPEQSAPSAHALPAETRLAPPSPSSANSTGGDIDPVLSAEADVDAPKEHVVADHSVEDHAAVGSARNQSVRFDNAELDSLRLDSISLDDLSLERHADAPAASGIAPMNLDEDAFFLEDLSLSESRATDDPSGAELSFDGFDMGSDDKTGTGRAVADLDLADLDLADLDTAALGASDFDAGDFDVGDSDAIFARPRPERETEDVISFEDLIASHIEAAAASEGAALSGGTGAADKPAPPPRTFSLGDLSLAPVDDDNVPVSATAAKSTLPTPDISALEARISGLSLVDIDGATSGAASATPFGSLEPIGVVLIEAGLGGPDPARQLLSTIPAEFPAIVLVRLHLQGGRYDRLVAQMERAAELPVALAESGNHATPGTIYFLPDDIGLVSRGGGLSFIKDAAPSANLIAALPHSDSAVVFLSGSDPQLVDTVMALAGNGLMVIAQSPDDCYDGAACAELRVRGVVSGLPAELAGRLSSRWPS